jgi:hypothetical protein
VQQMRMSAGPHISEDSFPQLLMTRSGTVYSSRVAGVISPANSPIPPANSPPAVEVPNCFQASQTLGAARRASSVLPVPSTSVA